MPAQAALASVAGGALERRAAGSHVEPRRHGLPHAQLRRVRSVPAASRTYQLARRPPLTPWLSMSSACVGVGRPAYVDPFHEKGGCGHCSLRSPSPYCDTEVMPPNDDVLLHCVINARAKACCHLPPSVWGRNLLIFLFVTGTLYVGGGLAYNIKYRGRGMSKESLPNYEAWVQLYGLTLDGWAFTRMRVKRSKAAYLTRKLLGIKGGGGYKPIPGQATRISAAASSNGSVTTAASGNASPDSGSTAKGKTPAAAQEESDEDMFGRDTSSSSDSDSDDSILE